MGNERGVEADAESTLYSRICCAATIRMVILDKRRVSRKMPYGGTSVWALCTTVNDAS
jgi:hypothetical protein